MGARVSQPLWRRWLSYLVEIHIESAPSEVNRHLYVSLSRGRYQLSTKNAVYSYADLYSNYRRTFETLDWEQMPRPAHVLLLGVGLCSIPYMLEYTFGKRYVYTGVEIDEHVLYLASKYVIPQLGAPVTLVHADGYDFVLHNTREFDIVCMDIFIDDTTPDKFESDEFLDGLRRATGQEGIVLYNCLAQSKRDKAQTQTFLHEQFLPVFPQGGYLDVGGNWMLVSDRTKLVSTKDRHSKRSRPQLR
ncbi:MAG: hypothetical protein R3301_04100 [Saprospiraceae bacterium]|nr:hypothetical protein [Saprospiraceae bacterium]